MRRLGSIVLTMLAASTVASAYPAAHPACPTRLGDAPASTRAGASQKLVPAGPRAMWLCRYSGLNRPDAHLRLLAARRVDDPALTSRLAGELDALPAQTGPAACPADDGSAIIVSFRYASGPADPVEVGLTGCRGATNGHVHRLAGGIADALSRLVPIPRGTVRGRIEFCGGPAPGGCRVGSATICDPRCVTSDRVAAVGGNGRVTAVVPVRGGRFALSLAGGEYLLRLLGDGRGRHGVVMEQGRVAVTPRRTKKFAFRFVAP